MKFIPCFLLALSLLAGAEPIKLETPIDQLIKFPSAWEITTDEFEKTYTQREKIILFKWITTDKTRGRLVRKPYGNVESNITMLDGTVPVEEVIVDFTDGKLDFITISIFNRGDASIDFKEFDRRRLAVGKYISQSFQSRAKSRKANSNKGMLAEGWAWKAKSKGFALLEHNEDPKGTQLEFLRLRIASPHSQSSLARAIQHTRGGSSIGVSELAKNVKKDADGNVYITGVPMVDQGSKGYCVCATIQRVFEHYGISVDMHQIAQIAGADPKKGTNTLEMSKQLDRVDYRFKTRLKTIAFMATNGRMHRVKSGRKKELSKVFEFKDFKSEVERAIDRGIPLLWSMDVGRVDEEPPLSEQTSGGHMRLIIGYNSTTQKLFFSDSWGAGHELKSMNIKDGYSVSNGLFTLTPTVH